MIHAIIADDDPTLLMVLRAFLEETGKVAVGGEAEDGQACARLLETLRPDALFLDIHMPGLTGLQVAELATGMDSPPLIAFITGYPEYAAEAFGVDAVDFLVKPLTREHIARTVARMERASPRRAELLGELQQVVARLVRDGLPHSRPLAVKDYEEGIVRLVDPLDVVSAERQGRRVVLRTLEREFPTYYSLTQLEDRFASHGFVRVSKHALVNPVFVDYLIPCGDGSYDLYLKDEHRTVIRVSRGRAKAFLASLHT